MNTLRSFRDDEALSPILGFSAAIVAYAFAFVLFISYSSSPATESSTVDSELQNRANVGLDLVITDGGGDWSSDPDNMLRFGLAGPNANFLDYDKIKLLRRAKMHEDPTNGLPDYPEAKRALALEDHQFHIRTYPVLVGLEDATWTKMRGFRVAYLADYEGPASWASITSEVVPVGNVREYRITVRNDHPDPVNPEPMIFVTSFTFPVNGQTQTVTRQTRLLDPGDSDTLVFRLHPLDSWTQAAVDMTLRTSDIYDNCTGCTNQPLTANTVTAGTHKAHILAETGAAYYDLNERVDIYVDHFTKAGGKRNGEKADIRVYRPDAPYSLTQEASPSKEWLDENLPSNSQRLSLRCPHPASDPKACSDTPGLWKVVVNPPSDAGRETTFHYWVTDTPLFTTTETIMAVANKERQYLDELVEDFDPARYSAGGDVFPDNHQKMKDLEERINNNPDDPTNPCSLDPDYDMLVVGSSTAHNALVKIKHEVANFVECGGVLIAFGSERSGTEWLQSVYHVALRDGAGGGISSPDPTHPLLNVPEKLSWNSYSPTDHIWQIKDGQDIFDHAVDGPNAGEMMLGVSQPGSLTGTVVLTGWTPGALTDPQDDVEAKKLMRNLLSQGYQMLFLDYGPPIPTGIPVGSSSRLAAVPFEELDEMPFVEVKIVLYVWRG